MKIFLSIFSVLVLGTFSASAQLKNKYFGIWQTSSEPLSVSQFPEIKGTLCNFYWKDLETNPGVWDWTSFDTALARRTQDGLPVIFMVYVRGPRGDAPEWLFGKGVPKVIIKDNKGNIIGSSPYYADSIYKFYFKKMIIAVHQHLETLPSFVRIRIIGVQGCFGSTGDFIGYQGGVVPSKFTLTQKQFSNLFREFTQYYFDEYKNTNPKIALLSNPKNQRDDDALWVALNCPGGWLKNSTIGKAFQLNDELDKSLWLYDLVNKPQNGDYIRMQCEIPGSSTSSGWWKKFPYRNMFGVMCYAIYWGLDWPNQDDDGIIDPLLDSVFNFFNKYAGQKDPAKSTNAMCALKDVLDASDSVRFPASIYGSVSRTNTQRYQDIANHFSAFGAKLEDVNKLGSPETDQLSATGTNDVGWRLLPGNYDRYLHQITPNQTSVGYWNVQSGDPNSMYGRFARGFDIVNNKDALYFDVDNAFLSNAPLNSSYPVTIEITYLDKGNGGWQLFYDAQTDDNHPSITVICGNSGLWKKVSVTLTDAYFGNRCINSSDFYIKSTNNENVIFAVAELTRPDIDLLDNNLLFSPPLDFDAVCATSTNK